jgi:hypothetical protein
MTAQNKFLDFADRYLVINDAKCFRHCQEPARFVPLIQESSTLVGAYVCPSNYVSRIVYFSIDPDAEWFEKLLKDQIGSLLRSRDLRVATRHGWELGGNAEAEISEVSDHGIKQYYWTFYPKSDEEKATGAFRCEKCGSLFVKKFADESKICSKCADTG